MIRQNFIMIAMMIVIVVMGAVHFIVLREEDVLYEKLHRCMDTLPPLQVQQKTTQSQTKMPKISENSLGSNMNDKLTKEECHLIYTTLYNQAFSHNILSLDKDTPEAIRRYHAERHNKLMELSKKFSPMNKKGEE